MYLFSVILTSHPTFNLFRFNSKTRKKEMNFKESTIIMIIANLSFVHIFIFIFFYFFLNNILIVLIVYPSFPSPWDLSVLIMADDGATCCTMFQYSFCLFCEYKKKIIFCLAICFKVWRRKNLHQMNLFYIFHELFNIDWNVLLRYHKSTLV